MTRTLRYVISAVVAAGFATGMGFLLHQTRVERDRYACSGMTVSFLDSLRFVSESEVRAYVAQEYGDFVGRKLDSLQLGKIEGILEAKSAVMDAQAWTTDDGLLHVDISQRAPRLRFQNGEKGFYVDDRGFIFPLHESYTAPVRMIDGNIPVSVPDGYKGEAPDPEERQWILGMLGLDSFIEGSKVWRDAVPGISVAADGDITLKTAKGEEIIILGTYTGLPDKFRKLEKYYGTVVPARGEGYYRTVNIKYKNQIVCRNDM